MKNTNLSEFLKEKRSEKKLSLRDIEKGGVDKTLFSKFERGLRIPKAETLKKISEILEIDLIELYKVAGYFTDEDIEKATKDNTLGEFLKHVREEKNITLEDVHNKGMDKSIFSQFESGIKTPNPENLRKIAKILEIDLISLHLVSGNLFIEEVEIHLHPEAKKKLNKVIAELKGIKNTSKENDK